MQMLKSLEKSLISFFPLENLTSFKIFNKNRVGWNYGYDIAIVPCFDSYSDLITGFSVRSLKPNNRGAKELNVFCGDIVYPMPFNLTNENLRNKDLFGFVRGILTLLVV